MSVIIKNWLYLSFTNIVLKDKHKTREIFTKLEKTIVQDPKEIDSCGNRTRVVAMKRRCPNR